MTPVLRTEHVKFIPHRAAEEDRLAVRHLCDVDGSARKTPVVSAAESM